MINQGRKLLISVGWITVLAGIGCQILHIPNRDGISFGFLLAMTTGGLTIYLYNGTSPLRVVIGLIFLTGALASLYVGLVQNHPGSIQARYCLFMATVFLYGAWVILVSRPGRAFLAQKRRILTTPANVRRT